MRSEILSLSLIALAILGLFVAARGLAAALPVQDLAQYWAAARLFRSNPYSQDRVWQLETSAGRPANLPPLVMRNPPWALPFVLPLGLMGYRSAFAFWAVGTFVVIAACSRTLWRLCTLQPSFAPLLMSLIYGPTVCLLILGQLAVLELLGVTLFLNAVQHRRDWIAGASVLLMLVKPHIMLLYLAAIFLWAVYVRRWAIIAGAALAVLASSLSVLMFDPNVFGQYIEFIRFFGSETVSYPNLGGILYSVSGLRVLALAPALCGVAWFAVYWHRRHRQWDWNIDGMLVLLVSVACSYYSYPYDEVAVLPALIAAAASGSQRIFFLGFVLTNIGWALYLFNVAGRFGSSYMFLWWTASAWLLTYWLSQRRTAVAAVANDD